MCISYMYVCMYDACIYICYPPSKFLTDVEILLTKYVQLQMNAKAISM